MLAKQYDFVAIGDTVTDAFTSPTTLFVLRAGTAKNLRVDVITAPGAGTTWTYTIRKNSVDTAVTCALTTTVSCDDTVNSVPFAKGDVLACKVVETGTSIDFSL